MEFDLKKSYLQETQKKRILITSLLTLWPVILSAYVSYGCFFIKRAGFCHILKPMLVATFLLFILSWFLTLRNLKRLNSLKLKIENESFIFSADKVSRKIKRESIKRIEVLYESKNVVKVNIYTPKLATQKSTIEGFKHMDDIVEKIKANFPADLVQEKWDNLHSSFLKRHFKKLTLIVLIPVGYFSMIKIYTEFNAPFYFTFKYLSALILIITTFLVFKFPSWFLREGESNKWQQVLTSFLYGIVFVVCAAPLVSLLNATLPPQKDILIEGTITEKKESGRDNLIVIEDKNISYRFNVSQKTYNDLKLGDSHKMPMKLGCLNMVYRWGSRP